MPQIIKSSFFLRLKKYIRSLIALTFRYKRYKPHLQHLLASVIDDLYRQQSQIPLIPLNKLIDQLSTVHLSTYPLRDGNTTFYEQIALAALLRSHKSKNVLELGTFDGHSTLTFALNAQKNSLITTVDMPSCLKNDCEILDKDAPFIFDQLKKNKLYEEFHHLKNIRQLYFNLRDISFSNLLSNENLFDFIFIDAGHSYECVKNDTEKAFKVLSPKGVIVWHDYTPNCQGVFTYLNELSSSLKLFHIEKTTLVVYCLNNTFSDA